MYHIAGWIFYFRIHIFGMKSLLLNLYQSTEYMCYDQRTQQLKVNKWTTWGSCPFSDQRQRKIVTRDQFNEGRFLWSINE